MSELRRKLATVFLGTMDDDPRDLTIDSIQWPNDRTLKQALHPYLKGGLKLSVKDLRTQVDPIVKSLLTFDRSQRAFLDALMAGKVDGALLFPDQPEIAAQVTALPALHWKVKKLKKVTRTPRSIPPKSKRKKRR